MTTAVASARQVAVRTAPLAAPLLVVAWVLLGTGLAQTNAAYARGPLIQVIAAGLLVVAAGVAVRRGTTVGGGWRPWLLGAILVAALAAVAWPPGMYARGAAWTWSQGLGGVAAVLAVLTLFGSPGARRVAWVAVLGLMVVAAVLMVDASPRPLIDVWVITSQATRTLLRGENLFTACWRANTDPLTTCVYPYLPLTTVVQVPFALLGDVRLALIAATAISSAVLYRLAGPAVAAALAALLLLQPKWLFLVEQSWTEPLLFAALCVMVWGVVTGRTAWAVGAFALALAMKQHMLLLVPLAAWWPAFGWRRTLAAVGIAVVAVGVFALPDPAAFADDVWWFHLDLPLRKDSLSLFGAAIAAQTRVPFVVVPLATVAILAMARALPRDAVGFTLGSAGVLLLFNIVNKHSFFNHYSLPLWLLVLALAVLSRESEERSGPVLSPTRPPPTSAAAQH